MPLPKRYDPRPDIYKRNYLRLRELGLLDIKEYAKLKNEPYMALSVEWIGGESDYRLLSICHYGEQNGDLMRDPDMVLRVYDAMEQVEALSFRNDYVGVYQVVYPAPDVVHLGLKRELNRFLETWLKNLKDQGFCYPMEGA